MSKETGTSAEGATQIVGQLMVLLQECIQGTQQLTSDVKVLTSDVETITGRVNAITDRTQEVQAPTARTETSEWHQEGQTPYLGALRPTNLKKLGRTSEPVLFAPREGYHNHGTGFGPLVGPSSWKAGD
jgi:hypothetical protein